MRKQDRIANQQQSREEETSKRESRPEPTKREQLKGSGSQDQPPRLQRQPGKLPLPD
jgi:hypothetical protein